MTTNEQTINDLANLIRYYARTIAMEGHTAVPMFDPDIDDTDGYPEEEVAAGRAFKQHKWLIWGDEGPPAAWDGRGSSRGWI